MLKQSVILIALGFVAFAYAGWIRTYGDHVSVYGSWVEQTSDGGYIIVGQDNDTTHNLLTSKPFGLSLFLVRTDSLGDTLWTKLYKDFPGSAFAWGRSIQKATDSRFVVVGSGGGYLWLLKFDADGDTLWTTKIQQGYQSSDGYCVRCLENGYVVSGCMQYEENVFYVVRFDSLGDTLWSRSYGKDLGTTIGFSIQPTSDGGFIATGSGPDSGFWILRMNSAGDTLWSKLYKLGDSLTHDEGRAIEPTSDGGWIITGAADCIPTVFGTLFIMKIGPLGNTLWTKLYKYGAAEESGNSVKETPDGGYVVLGCKNFSATGTGSIWLLKTDSAGDTVWTRTYGGKPQDRGNCIQLTPDGGYIITGYTSTYSKDGSTKALLMKLDSLGLLGIEDGPLSYALADWKLFNPVGSEVALRYSDFPQGFRASIFDASGRKVDEIHSALSSGTIVWGECYGPGVYFIKLNKGGVSAKVVIIK